MDDKIIKNSSAVKIYFYCGIILFSVSTALCLYFMKLLTGNLKTLLYAVLIIISSVSIILKKINKESAFRLTFMFLVFGFFFSVLFLILDSSGFWNNVSTVENMRNFISSQGMYSYLVFFAIQFLQVVVIPIPGIVTITAGVLIFGPVIGSIISYLGIVSGAIVAFIIGRKFGYKVVVWVIGENNVKKTLKLIKGKDKVIFAMMFLLPFFPDDMLCFVAGLTTMSLGFFAGMVLVTRIITILFTTFSTQITRILINTGSSWGFVALAIMGVLIIAVLVLSLKYGNQIQNFYENKLFKKHKKTVKTKQDKTENS